MADLSRHIRLPLEFDFMAVSSYGAATQTSGVVRILKDLDHEIEGRHVLLVEDIVDSGLTLNYLLKNLRTRKPASLEVCALLQKTEVQQVPSTSVHGVRIPPVFVVGLRARLRRAVPQPAVRRDASARGLPGRRLLRLPVLMERWASFDCYGTLVDWEGGTEETLARLWPSEDSARLLARYHEVEPRSRPARACPIAR